MEEEEEEKEEEKDQNDTITTSPTLCFFISSYAISSADIGLAADASLLPCTSD